MLCNLNFITTMLVKPRIILIDSCRNRIGQVEMTGYMKFSSITNDINWLMKMINGNRSTLDIFYQNIPGTLNKAQTLSIIENILAHKNPDILFVAEPECKDIKAYYQGYNFIKGTLNSNKKPTNLIF